MTICERVFSLLASDGRDQKDLAAHIGVSTRTLSTWKTRGTNPGAEYIAGIADFFSVSVDYILTGEEKQYSVSPADEEVLSAYHALSRPEQVYILGEMYRRAGLVPSQSAGDGGKKAAEPEVSIGSAGGFIWISLLEVVKSDGWVSSLYGLWGRNKLCRAGRRALPGLQR